MTSQVDATVPPDNVAVDKATLRANFLLVKNEITELQREQSLAWRIARGYVTINTARGG